MRGRELEMLEAARRSWLELEFTDHALLFGDDVGAPETEPPSPRAPPATRVPGGGG